MTERVYFIIVTAEELPSVNSHLEKRRKRIAKMMELRSNRRELYNRDPHCAYCRRELSWKASTLDHVVPKSRGGADDPSNTVLCCRNCNNSKDGRTVEEWRENWMAGLLFAGRRELAEA